MGENLRKLIINNYSSGNNCPLKLVKRGQVSDCEFKRLLNVYQRGQSSLDIEEIPVNIEAFSVVVDFFLLDVALNLYVAQKLHRKTNHCSRFDTRSC